MAARRPWRPALARGRRAGPGDTVDTTRRDAPIVLIVEDHDALRDVLREWVANIVPGAFVLSAGCVGEALDTMTRSGAHVVLMDIGLPGVDGIEGTRQIRARSPQTAVVVLSILDGGAHIAAAREAGAVAFVSKRRMRLELPSVLRGVLAEQSSSGGLP